MKTKEEMIQEGYNEDWLCRCPECNSWNCHKFTDITVCFDCNKRWSNESND